MIDVQNWEIWLILALQNSNEWLQPVMQFFTWMGYPQAYMLLIALVYWAFDSRLGIRMALFLEIGACINSLLKLSLHAPRPFWVDPQIEAIHPAHGFGMPSGHSQSATVWLLIAYSVKKWWFWILAIAVTLMIGLSRAFLGVHFPSQIITGWLLGIIIIVCFVKFEIPVIHWFEKLKITYQLLLTVGISFMIILTGCIVKYGLGDWTMSTEWIRNASFYIPVDGAGLISYSMISVLGNAGGFLGASAGAILVARMGGFFSGGVWWERLLRCIIGLVALGLLYTILTYISPDESVTLWFGIWRYCGFFILLFSGIYLLPLLFIRLNLARARS